MPVSKPTSECPPKRSAHGFPGLTLLTHTCKAYPIFSSSLSDHRAKGSHVLSRLDLEGTRLFSVFLTEIVIDVFSSIFSNERQDAWRP